MLHLITCHRHIMPRLAELLLCYYILLQFKLYRNIKRICCNDLLFDPSYGIHDCIIDNQSVLLSR